MRLQIETIADRGVPNMERVHLKVLETTNLSWHMVMASIWVPEGYANVPKGIANGAKSTFWFPFLEVKPGDDIVLVTRPGEYAAPRPNTFGGSTHFFYWGLQHTLFNSPSACAVVFDLATWAASPEQPVLQRPFSALVSGLPKRGA